MSYAICGLWLVVAALLWMFPMWTAHKLIPRTRFENKLNIQPLEAARVGCSLLGLWLLVTQFQSLVWYVIRVAAVTGERSMLRTLTPDERLSFLVTVAEIAFALLLIFGSAAFARVALRPPRAADWGE